MHMDPAMPAIVGAILVMLLTALALKLLKQPHVIAYLLAGIAIGPWGFALVTDIDFISRLGAAGVVLLLFFVGMETDPARLIANWKLAVFGTLLQIILSVGCIWLLGLWFDWPFSRILLIGFVISISSTAVVIKLLQDGSTLGSPVGQAVLGILLAQDLAIIPMLVTLNLLGSGELDVFHLTKQAFGTLAAAGLFAFIVYQQEIHLPLSRWLKQDRELQLFASLLLCFGLALITAWLDLSTALGAFLAGMLIGAARETQWVHHTLESFRVLFVAVFFVSIGMLLNLAILFDNLPQTLLLVAAALLTNTFINALIIKASNFSWRDSLYAGVLLSQIGEFSFVLAAVGLQAALISNYGYQLALCVISLSLMVSPLWINIGKRLIHWQPPLPTTIKKTIEKDSH